MATSKRGLCYPTTTGDPAILFTKPGSRISWLYNWSPRSTPNCHSSALQFIPMQWNHVNIDDLPSHCSPPSGSPAPAILTFNEPELDSQSNMPPSLAAAEYLRIIEPLRRAHKIRIGSPGISSSPHAVHWLKEFLSLIRAQGSDVDFYALHWYGEGLGPFYDYLWSTYYQLGADKPVWVTEFATTNWNAGAPLGKEVVEEFCRESCKYLDGLEWVERTGAGRRMCEFTGSMTQSGAAPGKCTNTAGYLGYAEVLDIIARGDGARYFRDHSSNTDVLLYQGGYIGYLTPTSKATRRADWMKLNFAGSVDWSVDLQSFWTSDPNKGHGDTNADEEGSGEEGGGDYLCAEDDDDHGYEDGRCGGVEGYEYA
ncbi:glycosyl hydrolase catalytic core-domain-containing protein [Cercophora newfieldiana]|uniref:Glycosyl hydrolase catalytic core-domain-containing protein n=1 Tax=Cercophora newfieldiana TaxID=92897 RepID=A0AA40CP00_9PEZI|nr:glycosyl hydrolase catalytic core-domain-containing protein [Cercophora newfieldiana]